MNESLKNIFAPGDQLDSKSVEFLINALASNSQQGFDYLKFKAAMHQLQGLGMDEATSVKNAFVTASTVGLSKDKLIHSSEIYRKVLVQEREQFDAAMRNQLEKRVASKEDETEYLKEKIIEYKQKIAELEENIRSYEQKVANADSEIDREKEKILSTQNKFEEVHSVFMETMEKDLKLFKEIL